MANRKRSAKTQQPNEAAQTALPTESTKPEDARGPAMITIEKDKAYRLAYRLIMARANRMTVHEAKTIVESVFGVPWIEIRDYVDQNPR